MSDARRWLGERRPRPPEDLAGRLADVEALDGSLVSGLTNAARSRLDEARAQPGRVRQSAFRLLEADALFTYACEAALETQDPAGVLRSILVAAGSGA